MDWPISEVARMSGVTARTLRHYDEIGLLPPARIGSNGHRYYEEHQLLLLQQILVLRELGVGLPEIGRVLADQVDTVEALRGHHRRLLAERDRLDALAGTVSRTIAELEPSRKDGTPMTAINRPENLFEGIQPSPYEGNLRDFPALAEEAGRRAAAMTPAEIDAQYRALTSLYAVSADEYRAVGRSCVENEDWRAAYEAIAPGLAEYQRDAIEVYAASRLG
ncbi:MerR family transcriptional regulator [Streptomyces parvus]|uniref:MerR family transcriptional regulator n=1 Tax=Streptomyces parvus TaxID=66428 RepID=A0A7K3RYU7_9ACTN|nr:MerR family transcriptional regulator [Streptomyces parvus]NEC20404.1 MerR family transcriptional regulator [Streptomyces parvus]